MLRIYDNTLSKIKNNICGSENTLFLGVFIFTTRVYSCDNGWLRFCPQILGISVLMDMYEKPPPLLLIFEPIASNSYERSEFLFCIFSISKESD
jgi:hypothetical protein